MVPEAGRAEEAQRAAGLKKVPLDGFMGEADWNGVCLEMRTRGGQWLARSGVYFAGDGVGECGRGHRALAVLCRGEAQRHPLLRRARGVTMCRRLRFAGVVSER